MSGHAPHAGEGKSSGGSSATAAAQPTPATPTAAAAEEPRKNPPRKAAVAAAEAITATVTGTGVVSAEVAPAAAVAAAAAGASPTRKRRLSVDGTPKPAPKPAKGQATTEHAAAARIQALVRGARARTQHKQDVLWNAWNLLDWREESALMSSHGAYEALKKAVQDRKVADEAEEKKAGGDGKAKRKRASSPSPRKKGRPSLSDAEAEAALGLGLGDRDPLTFTWLEQMMDCFKRNQQLPASLVLKLLARVTPLLAALPNIVQVAVPARVTVVGDLHGQLDDLLAIFKLQGLPSARSRFVFNGDFVDRGQHSVECILTLLAWKILLPGDVFLNRGNHEARDINGRDGFEKECLQKYPGKVGSKIFDAFSACFAALPIVHVIEQQVMVIHGGLFSGPTTLADIAAIDRFHEIPPSGSLLEEAMWSDPKPGRGRSESPRGAGLLFGPDVTKEFFKMNPPLNLIVRSHECMTKGFKLHHHDQVITVFSASNYTGTVGNDGALVVFERDGGTVLGGAAVLGSPRPGAHAGRPGSPAMGRPSSPTMGQHASTATPAAAASAPSTCPMSLRSPRIAPLKDATLHLPSLASAGGAAAVGPGGAPIVPLKRSILPFYASRKEKNASYRVTAGSNLETDIVARLLHLISDHRLSLIDYWSTRAQQHSSGVWTVTRAVWAAGLKACLGLSLPFLEFQELLGLPKLGVDGKAKGPVDFMAFLLRFRPVNLLVLRAQKNRQDALARSNSEFGAGGVGGSASQEGVEDLIPSPSPSPDGVVAGEASDTTVASLQQILELLHQKRFELESLFRFLDSDGNEAISHDEFREGIHALQHQLGTKFTRQQIDDLLHYIDADADGEISYSEFFNSFQLSDPQLESTLQRSKSIHEGVNPDAPHAAAAAADDDEPTTPLLDSLSPQHALDGSPPRLARSLPEANDSSDHDSTSTSHMHNHMHTRSDTCVAPQEEKEAIALAEEAEVKAQAETHDAADEPQQKRRKTHKD